MTYTVVLSRAAKRALSQRLPEGVAAACIEFLRGDLAANPRRVGKAMRGPEAAGMWTARRGAFRILYRIEDDRLVILVLTIDHRRDVYRR